MEYLAECAAKEAKDMMSLISFVKAYKEYVNRRHREEIHEILKECREERSENWFSNRGMSSGGTKKSMAKIPQWMAVDNEYGKYFDPMTPFEDRNKELEKLLKRLDKEYGNFRVNG